MTTHAVLYTRVSSDTSGRGRSVGEQEAAIRAFAVEEGWTIDEVFRDNDRSASRFATKERPGLNALADYLGSHQVDVLAIWEASRLARSMAVGIWFRDTCREHGVKIWFGERLYDMENPDDAKNFTDALVDAEHESAKTSKRVRRSSKARAFAGMPHGRGVYGYRRVYEGEGSERRCVAVVKDEGQADIVMEITQRVLAGEAIYRVANDLNARGVASPASGDWYASTITRLLRNPVYAGLRVHRGEIVGEGVQEALWDEVTWRRLQRLLSDPSRRSNKGRSDARYLLSGLITCGVCGGTVLTGRRGDSGRPAGTEAVRTYVCRGRTPSPENPKPTKGCVTRNVAKVDEYVLGYVRERLQDPELASAWATEDDGEQVAHVEAELDVVRLRLDEAYESLARGGISATALAKAEPIMLAEIERLSRERDALLAPAALAGVNLRTAADEWDDLTIETQRAIIRALFSITLVPQRPSGRTFQPDAVQIGRRARSA